MYRKINVDTMLSTTVCLVSFFFFAHAHIIRFARCDYFKYFENRKRKKSTIVVNVSCTFNEYIYTNLLINVTVVCH